MFCFLISYIFISLYRNFVHCFHKFHGNSWNTSFLTTTTVHLSYWMLLPWRHDTNLSWYKRLSSNLWYKSKQFLSFICRTSEKGNRQKLLVPTNLGKNNQTKVGKIFPISWFFSINLTVFTMVVVTFNFFFFFFFFSFVTWYNWNGVGNTFFLDSAT